MRTCPSCGEDNADRARFCQACGTLLDASNAAPAEVRKVVTVVFADVIGSTALGERLDPEALRRVMARYFDAMEEAIRAHGGTVEKFIGDAVMAVFGIPMLHEDDPIRAVRAAAGMLDALEAVNSDLERDHGVRVAVRIGVNTGEVVAGDPSAGQRLVTGDTVNVAARLEEAATPSDVLIGEATYRLVRNAVEVTEVPALELKGKAESVRAYRLVRVHADAPGHERRLDSPLVGRRKELELLGSSLERAVGEGTSHLFTVLGPAGIGKSRLVREFLVDVASGTRVLAGRCLPYGDGITFFPLAEVVHAAAGISDADPPAAARERLRSVLAAAADGDRIASLVGGLLGWDEPGSTQDAFWAVRKLLEHLARVRPVVVVLDDLHWAEPTFLDLIDHLADWTRDAPVLLLCLARPELLEVRPGWGGGKLNATAMLLEPLPEEAAAGLLDQLLGRADVPREARRRILEAADGNPLFVEEMLGMLIDEGSLRLVDGAWHAVRDLGDLSVPPTIQLLLAARLDRLDPEERTVIGCGAVEGGVFHAGAAASLAPESVRPHVPSRLLALARKELIRPDQAQFAGEDAFRFRHLLIRDAAYDAMPKERRAELHEAYASWLARTAGDRAAEYEEILAYHEEQTYRLRTELGTPDDRTLALGDAAAERLLRSADRAAERGDVPGCRHLVERAAAIARGSAKGRALFRLARVAEFSTDLSELAATAGAAVEAASEAGDRSTEVCARLLLTEVRSQTEVGVPIEQVSVAARNALEELEGLGDERGILFVRQTLARNAFYLGNAAESVRVALELVATPDLAYVERARLASEVGTGAYFGSTPAEDVLEIMDRLATALPDTLLNQARYHHFRTGPLGMLDRADEAHASAETADRIWSELGDDEQRIVGGQVRGEAERYLGRPDLAEIRFREGIEKLDRIGEIGFNSTATALLAITLCELERFDEAETLVQRSRAMAAPDDIASQNAWRLALSRIALARGDADLGIRLAVEALEIMSGSDYLAWIAESHEGVGMAALALGDRDRARAELAAARDGYGRKQIVRSLRRVDERLAALDA